jgi:hypothetical protein
VSKTVNSDACPRPTTGSGAVSKTEFESWYHEQLTKLVATPFDVLYGTTSSEAYWWFMQVLWLKTGINILCGAQGSPFPSKRV